MSFDPAAQRAITPARSGIASSVALARAGRRAAAVDRAMNEHDPLQPNDGAGPGAPPDDASRRPRPELRVVRTGFRHADAVANVVRRAHEVRLGEGCTSCPTAAMVRRQIRRFPEGQFVALVASDDEDRVVGAATLMRTDYPPTARPKSWMEMVGSLSLRGHAPEGRWLYGVEIAVDPAWQGCGVGSALYRRRKALVGELGLAGLYAGGMLKGYRRYEHQMTPRQYAARVRRGELEDPTVSMQLGHGFEAMGVIEDYDEDDESGGCAMLIVWTPPSESDGTKGER